jgi:hypothetical protein
VVCVVLQVWKVAVPDADGVHKNTCSGAVEVLVHEPACALAPLVVPMNVPPCGGRTIGLAQLPEPEVVGVGDGALLAVSVALAARVGVADRAGVGVDVLPGGMTVRTKFPLAPLKPSTNT